MDEGFLPAGNHERAGTGDAEPCEARHDVQGVQVMFEALAHLEGSDPPPNRPPLPRHSLSPSNKFRRGNMQRQIHTAPGGSDAAFTL